MIQAIKSSDHVCKTYNNIINHVPDSKLSEKRGKTLLPCIYIKLDGNIKKSFIGKIKVSVRKLLRFFVQGSGVIVRVAELIGN